MKTKGQSRGHCQVCGRIQVVDGMRNLAKHGYTVPSGYFRGTCQGSDRYPLQVSRFITDAIIKAMNETAASHGTRVSDLLAGANLPDQAHKLQVWGSRVYVTVDRKQVAVMVRWLDATDAEKGAQIKLEIGEAESHARFARGHAKAMTELAQAVHGTDLIDRDAEELARKAERAAKKAPIEGAFRTKGAQKAELEKLNRAFSKLRSVITETYLMDDAKRANGDPGQEMYYAMPYDLHNWRAKHVALVLDIYPELASTVEAIEILKLNRDEIKARPVIK